jgi:hypothetical protein
MKKLLLLLIIISSCKKDIYYYPSKVFFEENKPKEILIDNLSFKEITDSIRSGLFRKERYFIILNDFNSVIKLSPLAYTGGYIRERNILEIVDDSLWFSANKVSIKELGKHIKLHYENNGKEEFLSDSYKRAFIKLNLEPKESSEKLKVRLLDIIKVYNLTIFQNKDSVNLDIMLDYNFDKVYPQTITPRPDSLEIED